MLCVQTFAKICTHFLEGIRQMRVLQRCSVQRACGSGGGNTSLKDSLSEVTAKNTIDFIESMVRRLRKSSVGLYVCHMSVCVWTVDVYLLFPVKLGPNPRRSLHQ